MEKLRKYNLVVLILSWVSVVLCIAEVCLSIVEAMPNVKYGPAYFIAVYIFSGITAVALFNAIWLTVRHKKYPFGGLSLALAIIQTVISLALPSNSMNVLFGNNMGRAVRLAEFIIGAIALIIAIVKLVYSILLFSGFRKGTFAIPGTIAEKKPQEVSTVKSKKKKKGEMAQIDPDNYEEFDLDHKCYLYLFGAFFIIFEKKCFGWRYIGKSKEGEITKDGIKVLKYAWFSRAHELKTSKLFKFVEVISNIFIWLSNLLTTLILLVIGIIILLFVLGVKNAAIGVIISYVSMIAFNVLLALLGKLLFKVQKVRENNPPGFFDYLDSAVDEEREVMEKMRHEKEKKEFVEEVRKASKADHTSESSESEKLRLLKEYKELLKDGTITKKEFDAKKKELLK